MTTSLTHEWNTNPDPHGLYLRCLAVLLILVTQRGPVRPTIVYHDSERVFSRKSSLKYWWAGHLDSWLLNGLCGDSSKDLGQRTTIHTVV